MDFLPIRIMKMVRELHCRGYTSLYLYSGISPTGFNWRYSIGIMENGKWPTRTCIVSDSIGTEGETEWAPDNSTVVLLTDGFEQYYADQLAGAKKSSSEYSIWYSNIINSLEGDEVLAFYADYGGPHEHLIAAAPGYNKIS